MSATSHEALPKRPGQQLRIGARVNDAPDPTEDIGAELTSELMDGAASGDSMSALEGQAAAKDPAPPHPEAAPVAGSILRDRYVLDSPLGSGGTAVVFRAVDLRRDATGAGGREVAVKLLRPDRRGEPRYIARLQREFRLTQSAAHPNVVRIFDLDCDRGDWFIVMELLAGETLAARLHRAAPSGLPVQEALAIAAAIADALAHAHVRRVIHGDVKPANIFITDAGEVRLLDFGVAPEPEEPREPAAGTRVYASPEVLGGERAAAGDDVFSLACVACEMLSGRHPYGRRGADAAARAGITPERPAGLDDASWHVLLRALDLRRPARPGMEELARALRGEVSRDKVEPAAVAAAPAAAMPAPDLTLALPARRSRLVAGSAVAASLMLLLGILIGRIDRDPGQAAAPVAPSEPVAAGTAPASPPSEVVAPEAAKQRPQANDAPEPEPEATIATPPAATGLVTFDRPSMVVSSRAVVAAVPLRHLNRTPRDMSVNWRIIQGSARPGRDYGGPESGVESFVAGNSFRILYVPIVANPAATSDRTFVIELTGATPGVEVGGAPRIAVTILGDG